MRKILARWSVPCVIFLLAIAGWATTTQPAAAQSAPFCGAGESPAFVFGFAALREQVGGAMGAAIECEHADPVNGDTLQQTTTGLSFYRKITNTATFTDGFQHWGLTADGLRTWTGSSIDPPANVYPDGATTAFVNACDKNDSSLQAPCRCAIEKIESRYTLADFLVLAQRTQTSGGMAPELTIIMSDCLTSSAAPAPTAVAVPTPPISQSVPAVVAPVPPPSLPSSAPAAAKQPPSRPGWIPTQFCPSVGSVKLPCSPATFVPFGQTARIAVHNIGCLYPSISVGCGTIPSDQFIEVTVLQIERNATGEFGTTDPREEAVLAQVRVHYVDGPLGATYNGLSVPDMLHGWLLADGSEGRNNYGPNRAPHRTALNFGETAEDWVGGFITKGSEFVMVTRSGENDYVFFGMQ
jgi:hypothetical protein